MSIFMSSNNNEIIISPLFFLLKFLANHEPHLPPFFHTIIHEKSPFLDRFTPCSMLPPCRFVYSVRNPTYTWVLVLYLYLSVRRYYSITLYTDTESITVQYALRTVPSKYSIY